MNNNLLFDGIEGAEYERMRDCLQATEISFPKNALVFPSGQKTENVFLVLSGSLNAESTDINGNVSLVSHISRGGIFGGAFAVSGETVPLDLRSAEACKVLLIPINRLCYPCLSACSAHRKLLDNFIRLLAAKSVNLLTKITHVSQRTVRGKLTAYLSTQEHCFGKSFCIPLNRQQLADYLETDRCALSRELSLMKKEGLLDYHKNRFTLLKQRDSK